MKQKITKDQFEKLNTPARGKLIQWWKDHRYPAEGFTTDGSPSYVPLLMIGQMVQFLQERYDEVSTFSSTTGISGVDLWNRGEDLATEKTDSFEEQELCDALWKAVKNKL